MINQQDIPARGHEQSVEKAARLIREGRVHFDPDARVYPVRGDTGTYKVIIDAEGIHCPCPARVILCSHALAAAQLHAREHASIRELFYGPDIHTDVDRPSDEDGLEPREPIAPWGAS